MDDDIGDVATIVETPPLLASNEIWPYGDLNDCGVILGPMETEPPPVGYATTS